MLPWYFYVQLLINGLSLGSIYAVIALGFTLIFSVLKFSNFSHGGIMVMGAYAAFVLNRNTGMGFIPMMLLTAIIGALLSCVVQFIGFERLRRKQGNDMLLFVSSATLGLLLQNIIVINFAARFFAFPVFFRPMFFNIGPVTVATTEVVMFAFSAVCIVLLMIMLYKTRVGIAIRAMALDSNTVKLMGINVSVMIAIAFLISGALGAVAGVFSGMTFVLQPQLNELVLKGMIASVLGGLGNISGALFGGILLAMMEIFLTYFVGGGLMPAVVFIFAMVFLWLRPQGIAGKFTLEKV
ncbi:MAG: branched-chain amino acid ABC transporter permease [Oscillospiraceae bacterium]|nr:branched-chain amino acid ABC transporter permease [Oscillospiraceae bacterium]